MAEALGFLLRAKTKFSKARAIRPSWLEAAYCVSLGLALTFRKRPLNLPPPSTEASTLRDVLKISRLSVKSFTGAGKGDTPMERLTPREASPA